MIKNLYKTGNAVDDIYTNLAGVPYPVSAAIKKPEPTPIQFNSTVTYTELSADNWKLEIVPEWPEGINFDVLNTLYPNWLGEINNGIITIEFNSDSITENYVTIENITFGEVPAEGTTCLINLKNSDVVLAESTASAHVVEIPVPDPEV